MKRLILLLSLILCLIPALMSYTVAQVYSQVNTRYNGISSYSANVSQTNLYRQMNSSITYSGKLYYLPGRMLMHFDNPEIQRLQIEGGRVSLYDGMSGTLIRSAMSAEYQHLNPVTLLQSYRDKSTTSITAQSSTEATLRLIPRDDPMLASISATVSMRDGLIKSLSYTDKSGNSVSYSFSSIRINGSIPAGVWNYSYPPETMILDQ